MEEFELYNYNDLENLIKEGLFDYLKKEEENSNVKFLDFDLETKFTKKYENNFIIFFNLIKGIHQQLSNLSISNGIILYSQNYIEIPIFFKQTTFFPRHDPINLEDNINHITYEISNASKEYNLLLLNHCISLSQKDNEYIKINTHVIYTIIYNSITSLTRNESSQKYILSNLFDVTTIKIKSEQLKNYQELQTLSNSFFFQFMITYNVSCGCYYSVLDIINQDEHLHLEDINKLQTLPKRIYKESSIDYYRLALSSNEPFSQYLSYYHVLEVFFEGVFKEKLRETFQRSITSPHFSYKNNDNLDSVIKLIQQETRNCRENGQGNEFESLKLVLWEYVWKYITIQEFKEKLLPNQAKYYQQHEIQFIKKPIALSFNNESNFCDNLAQRIYQTRNSLVHSKEGNVGRYKPYQDSEELSKEIPLIKLIAELVIINSSDLL